MKSIVFTIQIIVSCLLMAVILLQAKSSGLTGGGGNFGDFFRSKRGMEKTIFLVTIFLAALFLITSIANLLLA